MDGDVCMMETTVLVVVGVDVDAGVAFGVMLMPLKCIHVEAQSIN